MRVEGEDLAGVSSGTEFLIKRGLEEETPVGERVVVIGGGNTAIDAARTSWRLGAKEVTVLYRRGRGEMPANDSEVVEADHEGVKFHFLAAPTRMLGQQDVVKAMEYIKMELGEPDASGRRRPVPKEGSETELPVTNVFAAIGQFPDLSCLRDNDADETGKQIECTRWNTVIVNEETMQTNVPWVFSAGDCQRGAATVVEAIGDGRRAAAGIHLFLAAERVKPITVKQDAPAYKLGQPIVNLTSPADVDEVLRGLDRVHMNELGVEDRRLSFVEVELGLMEDQALKEADRCLDCGLICYRQTAREGDVAETAESA
jgi:NADPH-dependent glutamate synthase beta subunit-like oxidoreductase